MNSSDIKAEAQKIASVLSTTVAGSVSVAQDNAKAEITGLEPGYYLIKDKDSSLKGDEAYTEYISISLLIQQSHLRQMYLLLRRK